MHLKQPFWKTGSNSNSQARSESAVSELVNSLDQQRLYREVILALRTGLREARAEFSFLRVHGLCSLLKFLRSVADSDATINLFCNTQSLPDLQVVPVLLQQSLRDTLDDENIVPDLKHIFGVEPKKINSPPTDEEVALAIRVLEGCCVYMQLVCVGALLFVLYVCLCCVCSVFAVIICGIIPGSTT